MDGDIIITIFNFTILAIYAYLEWKNLTQRAICNYKIAMLVLSTGKTTLAVNSAGILQNRFPVC
jgi:hypothetical protein